MDSKHDATPTPVTSSSAIDKSVNPPAPSTPSFQSPLANSNSELNANPTTCPTCHQAVKPADYFCANCGANLKPAPPSTTITSQLTLYFKSAILPPLGFIWGFKYLRQPDAKSKIIGLIAMGITTAILIFITLTIINIVNTVNEQVNSQLDQMML